MKKYKALLEQQQLLPLTRVPGFECLVERVAGEPVKGSWWGHPKGKEIFAIAEALDDSPDVLVSKILDKKQTFVHKSLFAALYRVVTDRAWRKTNAAHPHFLEREYSEHTASGKHVKIRQRWEEWASEETKAAAKSLSFEEAYEQLVVAGRGRLTLPNK